MRPTEILSAEHRVILVVLDCLERMALSSEPGSGFDVALARRMTQFFREFADRAHHGKEEALLFPKMEARGFPADDGPLAVMRFEHEEGRRLVTGMIGALEAFRAGRLDARHEFGRQALTFCDLLRGHIQKEDHCLFPMADQAFTGEDLAEMSEGFRKVDEDDLGRELLEGWIAFARDTASRFGVACDGVGPAAPRPACQGAHPHRCA